MHAAALGMALSPIPCRLSAAVTRRRSWRSFAGHRLRLYRLMNVSHRLDDQGARSLRRGVSLDCARDARENSPGLGSWYRRRKDRRCDRTACDCRGALQAIKLGWPWVVYKSERRLFLYWFHLLLKSVCFEIAERRREWDAATIA